MAQTTQYNVQEVVQSLADSIQEKLVKPSESKFTSLLEKTNITEEQVYQRLNELSTKVEELKKTQTKLGILCLTLSLALVINIVMQVL